MSQEAMVATITNYHKLHDLKQNTFVLLWFWSMEFQNPKSSVSRAMLPGISRRESVPCLFQLLIAASIPWLVGAPLSLGFCVHITFSYPTVLSRPDSLMRTVMTAFWILPNNPELFSHLKILKLNHICRPFLFFLAYIRLQGQAN